jgi:hypothetical protein
MQIGDGKNSDQGSGWKKLGSGIRDKHPGSATLIRTRLDLIHKDPQHCLPFHEPLNCSFDPHRALVQMAVRAAEALGRRARAQDPRDEDLLALSQGDRGQAAQRACQAGSVGYPEQDP